MLDELEFTHLTLDQHGDLAVLTLNRPQALNALNGELLIELVEAVEAIAETAEIGALIITGGGEQAFVAGADIGEFAGSTACMPGARRRWAGKT